jgi:hypothetical protein
VCFEVGEKQRDGRVCTSAYVSIRQHTSAYVSIRQHTSAYVSIRQRTSAYVRPQLEVGEKKRDGCQLCVVRLGLKLPVYEALSYLCMRP